MELTIKELSPYLPYGLHILRPDGRTILEVKGLIGNSYLFIEDGRQTYGQISHHSNKPLLLPLDHLTKEIEHEGKKFVPMEFLETKAGDKLTNSEWVYFTETIYNEKGYDNVQHWIYQDLIKWHLDVFNLIPRGLAIDKSEKANLKQA